MSKVKTPIARTGKIEIYSHLHTINAMKWVEKAADHLVLSKSMLVGDAKKMFP